MSNSIKFKTTFVGEPTTYKPLTERVNTFVVILPNEKKIKLKFTARSIHCGGRHFQVLCEIFSLPQIPKTVQISTGKNSAKCNALNSYIECGYKLHSRLGSVGKLSAETNFNFPAPPFNHISGICKNLPDTWPAATRVLSRGRKREDPGNEIGRFVVVVVFWSGPTFLATSMQTNIFPR